MTRAAFAATFLCLMALYVQAAVSGADSALANSVLMLALALIFVAALLVGSSVSWKLLHRQLIAIPMLRRAVSKASEHAHLPPAGRAAALLAQLGDLARAALLFGGSVPFIIFLALSLAKQRMRELVWLPRGVASWTEPRSGMVVHRGALLTPAAQSLVELVRAWVWALVLPKAMWIGVVVMIMNVGFGKLLNLGLSVLIQALLRAQLGLGVVSVAYFIIGFVLFMLPPVPGPSVYLLGSFLIPNFTAFWPGIALATAISFTLKMITSAVQ
ncbi:hypothetical protein T492DRAFT_610490, partial [Pavlovales sp. CCMP2436]